MKAGFHTADITPAIGMEAPGGYLKAYIKSIHDPLKVRAAVFEDGREALAFLGVDTCYLQSAKIRAEIRREVESRCGIPGDHLLIAASLTLGYTASVPSLGGYLAGVAYDVGANALSVEWLFHGALFSALWRRWTFWPAAAISTGAGLLRYLVDPTFPTAPEAAAGAVFYLTILGLASCALRAWSGSVLPGYLATLVFFAAYRALHV